VGPDVFPGSALGTGSGMHDGQDVDEAVSGVVEPAPVHTILVQAPYDGLHEGRHPPVGAGHQSAGSQRHLAPFQLRPNPGEGLPPEVHPSARHLPIEFGEGLGVRVGTVEELALHRLRRERRFARRIGEEAQHQGEPEDAHQRNIPGTQTANHFALAEHQIGKPPPSEGLDVEEPLAPLSLEVEGPGVHGHFGPVCRGERGPVAFSELLHILGLKAQGPGKPLDPGQIAGPGEHLGPRHGPHPRQ